MVATVRSIIRANENFIVLAAAAAAQALLLLWILFNPAVICTDNAECLQSGQLIWLGKHPYVDFVPILPPLIFYLHAIPAGIAINFNFPQIVFFSLSIWVVCVLSKLAIWQVVSSADDSTLKRLAAPIILCAACFDLMTVYYPGEIIYGQREHLIVLLYLPYLLLRWLRWNAGSQLNRFAAIFYGITAGIALCIKPYFILISAVVELTALLGKRKPSTLMSLENFAVLGFAVLYVAHFAVNSDAKIYLDRWLPLVFKGYDYCSFPLDQAILISYYMRGHPVLLLLALGPALLLQKRCSFIQPIVIGAVVCYAIYLLQGKMWPYQALPFLLFITILWGLIAWVLILGRRTKSVKASSIFTGCTVLCAGLVWLFINCTYCIKEAPYVVMPGREVAKLIKQKTASDDSVLFLSTWPSDPYPVLLETNHRSGCRYPFIYPLQLLRYCRSISTEPAMLAHYVEEERRIADEIASDIKSRKPKLIFIRSVPLQQAHSCVSVVDFIKANPHLSDAIDQNYDQLSMIGALKVYERMR